MPSNEYLTLNSKIEALARRVTALENQMSGLQTNDQADQREAAMMLTINDLEMAIGNLQQKLSTIQLPSETRNYLTQQEMSRILSMSAEFISLKSEIENVLNAILPKIQYLDNLG